MKQSILILALLVSSLTALCAPPNTRGLMILRESPTWRQELFQRITTVAIDKLNTLSASNSSTDSLQLVYARALVTLKFNDLTTNTNFNTLCSVLTCSANCNDLNDIQTCLDNCENAMSSNFIQYSQTCFK
jgi:hypothetical protein